MTGSIKQKTPAVRPNGSSKGPRGPQAARSLTRNAPSTTVPGFTIIELLIAVIIIGVLVAILIPVLVRRVEEARIARAESDVEHIKDALERAHIHTNYVYRLYVLDDNLGGNGLYLPLDPGDLDGVRDETGNWTVQTPTRMFIDYNTGQFAGNYQNIYASLTRNETDFGWAGPYINYQRGNFTWQDLPTDPWGEEYLLFTPAGVVDQQAGTVENFYNFTVLGTDTTVTLRGPFFDRFTVLSKGPNRAPGDGSVAAQFGIADDIYRQF
ncbi:prepilin-type N-terminal cleavage/methylation domain-containing protein [Candidatus Sumerlaeota bacterium]|nr:prepilin-type N-terminal cleavage/methylation domain-containing protein [Candidatus Sumerlaeota bacterium]